MSTKTFDIFIETVTDSGGKTGNYIRARPLPGQGYPADMRVSCSKSMRNNHPIGTQFCLAVKLVVGRDGTEYLYANPRSNYEVLAD